MSYSKFDLFSSSFFFNIGSQYAKKGTIFGTILSFFVLVTSATYLVYILYQYSTNQLDPNFRSQSFISDHSIEMELKNDMIGFRFEYDSNLTIEDLQIQNNKTYIVYIAQLYQSDQKNYSSILLDIIDCTSPSLLGYKCLDFSKVSNYTFALNTQNSLQTQINILTYGCQDLDSFKTTIPENCANQTEIDNIVNGINALLRLKFYTSQFNTTSQQIQVNYRNSYVYTVANQLILSRIKTQKQITSVKTGSLIQSQMSFSSPIQYDQQDQALDRNYASQSMGLSCYSHVLIYPDELVQQIQIQFPTLPQVTASVNSIFTLLMLLGHIGRAVSNRSIRKDFFMLFLKNLYQFNYLSMLGLIKSKQHQGYEDSKIQQQQLDNEQQQLQSKKQQIDEEMKMKILRKYQKQVNQEQSIDIKNEDEQQKSKSVPLFHYRPSLNMGSRQQQSDNSCNIQQEQHINLEIETNNQLVQQIKKKRLSQEEDASKCNQDFFIQKQIIEDQQASSINLDQVFSVRNNNYQQKANIKESQQNLFLSCNLKGTTCIKIIDQEDQPKQNHTQINQTKEQQVLNESQCVRNLQAVQDKDISSKLYRHIFRFKFCKKRQKSDSIEELNKDQQLKIENHVSQDLDILNFINDMIFLKKAVMILLRKDQLAALKLIGFSPSFLEQNNQSINFDPKQKKMSKNYYETQYAILKSEKLQQYQIEKFVKRCQNKQKLSEIDRRIQQSLKANQIL
ncbi:AMP-binding enzyme family protein (macronuclear) [Tetrahymena thermophila SB210]|uniref:AMP-binding enzyme family protein n=1 Tax=Tetrahymena thermophila (strain SB210) TaxID=312017 RepID=Q229V9_TETTS|nr:AMP-binding enzyme family protein [Tetrahymena thermophila SB210]EAR82079.2 AMP-binding enzyme family protein [Tetrahymena thermophila SB210]|eukprot:XP_001029742.2 AMP-binding enzyme family protein [Tetrahymena thermophila SB210]